MSATTEASQILDIIAGRVRAMNDHLAEQRKLILAVTIVDRLGLWSRLTGTDTPNGEAIIMLDGIPILRIGPVEHIAENGAFSTRQTYLTL